MISVYCAASSHDGERIRHWERELRKAGIAITGTWSNDCEAWAGKDGRLPRLDQRNQALLCTRQIIESDAVWLMMPEAGITSIGAFWEAGIATAYRKRLFISGSACRASVFCGLAEFNDARDSMVFAELLRLARSDDTVPMSTIGLSNAQVSR